MRTTKKKDIITVTRKAIDQMKELIASRDKESIGIRIGLSSKGCSGLSYILEYADESNNLDEIVDVEDIKILIDSKSVLFLIGTEIDYVEEKMSSGFKFNNPNEKGRCGCQKSFHV